MFLKNFQVKCFTALRNGNTFSPSIFIVYIYQCGCEVFIKMMCRRLNSKQTEDVNSTEKMFTSFFKISGVKRIFTRKCSDKHVSKIQGSRRLKDFWKFIIHFQKIHIIGYILD